MSYKNIDIGHMALDISHLKMSVIMKIFIV